jgi:ATP-dependent helicase/nuclease subunit A
VSERLTKAQRRAADPGASVWVEASAGTGKTQVLTARVLRLLLGGTAPTRILCLTFTKAAAAEMRTRIADRLGLWAIAEEGRLSVDIAELEGKPPDAALLAHARRLFARVLDAPGGMRIMTIHAFCQSVLQRFPLEAGVAPHFTVLDEAAAEDLMRDARDTLLRAEAASPALGDPLRLVAELVSEEDFAKLMKALADERGRLARAIENHGGIEGLVRALRVRHGVEGVAGEEALVDAAAAEGAFDRPALTAACRALLQGSKTDAERGQAIADWLAAGAEQRAAIIGDYASAYLTDKGKIRDRLATKEVEQKHPGIVAVLQAEAERLLAVEERRRAFAIARVSEAIARLGAAMLQRYQQAKRDAAALDYDDLIEATCRLLEQPDIAPWVLFKLDGGLDHILIDEAQDTNPDQWRVVRALAEEFFAGAGARDAVRTVFAVGDPKQSIFSFQRADPRAFAEMRRYFAERVAAAGLDWRDEALEISFRSAPPILALVDAVFAIEPARNGVVAPGRTLKHDAHRARDAGQIELWPAAVQIDQDQPEAWAPPTERSAVDLPRARLAEHIAERIADWVAYPRVLPSRGRPIRPGDVMILVRRRDALVEELVRALKDRHVRVAGVDRMVLTEQLAVMDLMALGKALLLPEDDLTLATVLKSPLFGFSEDQLLALAHGRTGSLWAQLNARAAADAAAPEAAALAEFDWMLRRADFLAPHALFAEILSARNGRAKLLRRLGPDAADPLDEFLTAALQFERIHPPSLQGFLRWLDAGAAEIKRDLDQAGRDEVRIMTVHGAKGLQAPIVILPDTEQVPNRLSPMLWSADGLPIWVPRAEMADSVATTARNAAKCAQEEEYRRLLYVALTRAEDRLYVTGWRGQRSPPADCWYNLVQQGAARLEGAVPLLPSDRLQDGWEGRALRLASEQLEVPERQPEAPEAASDPGLPDWARRPPPAEPHPPRPLAPSQPEPEEGEPPVLAPIGAEEQRRFRRGRLIHRLLQVLPELPPARRRAAAARLADRLGRNLPEAARAETAEAALRVIERPELAELFAPASRAEAPIVGRVGGRILSGQIDRIVVQEDRVLLVDYKTNRPPPRQVEEVPTTYLRQMAAYRAAIAAIYPERPIRAVLLWTDGPSAMVLPDALLDRFDPSRERDPAPP